MAKLSINLLPQEYLSEEVKKAKFYRVRLLSFSAIMLVVFFSAVALALGFLQSQNIKAVEARITEGEEKVTELVSRQTALLVIKNRLSTINQYLGVTSKQVSTYNLLEQVLPERIALSSLAIDKAGDASLVAVVPDGVTLDQLIADLTSRSDKIASVSLESLNRGRDESFRVSLKIKPK